MNTSIKGWTYRVYMDDLDAQVFGPFSGLVDLWRQKSGAARYPAWRDFEFGDFSDWWGRLSLCDIHTQPFDIEFVLWGTALTEWWGIDYTRKKMSETYENRVRNWEKFEGPYFRYLTGMGGIGVVKGDLRVLGRGFVSIQGIDLPLIRDGHVTQVLSGYRVVDGDETADPVAAAKPVWEL